MKQHIRTAPAIAADFLWKSTRGALIAAAVGAIGAFGGLGMARAGVPDAWIWLWGIAAFAAFTGGLCFWAMHSAKRWGTRRPARPAVVVSADTITYWYAAGLASLINMLATALMIVTVDVFEGVGPHIPIGVVCNLAGYLVIIGALRHPTWVTVRPRGKRTDRENLTHSHVKERHRGHELPPPPAASALHAATTASGAEKAEAVAVDRRRARRVLHRLGRRPRRQQRGHELGSRDRHRARSRA